VFGCRGSEIEGFGYFTKSRFGHAWVYQSNSIVEFMMYEYFVELAV